MMKFSLLLFLALPAYGLVCYDNEKGLSEVSNDSWDYCVLIPQSETNEARMFGISSQEDSVTSYETSFKTSENDPVYKVLSVCLLEKYDLGAVNPKFGKPEFLFRCICNYDRCNSHQTFSRYISSVRSDNA